MSEEKNMRLNQAAKKLNIGTNTIVEFLTKKGFQVENNPNSKISQEQYEMLAKEYRVAVLEKEEASHKNIGSKHLENVVIKSSDVSKEIGEKESDEEEVLIKNNVEKNTPKVEKKETIVEEVKAPKLQGLKIVDKIDLGATDKKTPKAEKKAEEKVVKTEKKVAVVESTVKEVKVEKAEKITEEVVETKPAVTETLPENKVVQEEVVAQNPVKEENKEISVQEVEATQQEQVIKAKAETLGGLKVIGKIELPVDSSKKGKHKQPVASSDTLNDKKKKRNRIKKKKVSVEKDSTTANTNNTEQKAKTPNTNTSNTNNNNNNKGKTDNRKKYKEKEEISQKEIQDRFKATLAQINSSGGNVTKKKSVAKVKNKEKEEESGAESSNIIKLTEFISANDLATLMDVSVNEVISKCLSLGMFVSINQRLDAEAITIIADEFNYQVEFISAEEESDVSLDEQDDSEEELIDRPPIVTVMGHVDHGKTSLLDYIRKTNVTAKEAGGITQHIGAYSVTTEDNRKITFLDTPGHEAFTAMRARGAKLTDVAIIVVAADDSVMPQTREAINHALNAGVPIVIAISKVDKPNANPDRVREQLANENILVEEWGGKYQCQEISSKSGQGIPELLEKVLLEAEILELKANPDKNALGTVIEASLDKGRGYVTNILVQAGTLKVGDIILAGHHYGRVRAMVDYRGKQIKTAGPSMPVQILGLAGAPQAGDRFHVMDTEREAREIATKREQILREQSIRTTKRLTLGDIARRIALGSFKELNVIIKGDVDGSVEALSDSLLKLSTPEVQVNVLHKGVGQITETDVNLAAASDAVIIGFQVRPALSAKKLAEQEQVEIRMYSIIYDAINEVKDAMEGMLAPTIEEVIVGNVEVREIFKISKIGTIAGCYVLDGYIKRHSKVRVIRNLVVCHTGEIDTLKRFKDDASEVKTGYECGLSIKNFNDIEVGDIIEVFELKEVKRTL
jgi:translation initiation factor IF-2